MHQEVVSKMVAAAVLADEKQPDESWLSAISWQRDLPLPENGALHTQESLVLGSAARNLFSG